MRINFMLQYNVQEVRTDRNWLSVAMKEKKNGLQSAQLLLDIFTRNVIGDIYVGYTRSKPLGHTRGANHTTNNGTIHILTTTSQYVAI